MFQKTHTAKRGKSICGKRKLAHYVGICLLTALLIPLTASHVIAGNIDLYANDFENGFEGWTPSNLVGGSWAVYQPAKAGQVCGSGAAAVTGPAPNNGNYSLVMSCGADNTCQNSYLEKTIPLTIPDSQQYIEFSAYGKSLQPSNDLADYLWIDLTFLNSAGKEILERSSEITAMSTDSWKRITTNKLWIPDDTANVRMRIYISPTTELPSHYCKSAIDDLAFTMSNSTYTLTYHLGSQGQFDESFLSTLRGKQILSYDKRTLTVYNLGVLSYTRKEEGLTYGTQNYEGGCSTSGYVNNPNSVLLYWASDPEGKNVAHLQDDGKPITQDYEYYAVWGDDKDRNGVADIFENSFRVKAGEHLAFSDAPQAVDPAVTTITENQAGKDYTVYTDLMAKYYNAKYNWEWMKHIILVDGVTSEAYLDAYAVVYQLTWEKIMTAMADKTQTVGDLITIPTTTADSGYQMDSWDDGTNTGLTADDISGQQAPAASYQTVYTANPGSDVKTISLDTAGVYNLLYSGTSKQELSFTLSDGSNQPITDANIRNKVTFSVERTDGFEKLEDYEIVTINGTTVTAKKSGIVKVYAHYGDIVSSNYAVFVVPGDLDKNGYIALNDAVIAASLLRDDNLPALLGTYGQYLSNLNNIEGTDVDDVVKIASMVRKISDYYN